MKKGLRISIKSVIFLLAILAFNFTVKALPYTAVNSGNWSNPATWGGIVPPTNISLDQITIPAGKTVTMDQDCNCNGLLASLNVMGTLNSTADKILTLGTCTLLGSGLIDVDKMVCNSGAVMLYTGAIVADVFQSSALNLDLQSNVTAVEQLLCTDGLLSMITGGQLTMGSGAEIVINGGSLSLGNTSLGGDLYNVLYQGGSCSCGDELKGPGLNNIMVNVANENSVLLNDDLNVKGTLSLNSGSFVLNGHDLTISGNLDLSGTGDLQSTSASNITINVNNSITGELKLTDGSQVNTFTLNISSGGDMILGSDLNISTSLGLSNGVISTGDNGINLGANATINGGGLSTYVNTGDNGHLSITLSTGGLVNFPVGTDDGYAPIEIDFNGGNGTVDVTVKPDVLEDCLSGSDLSLDNPLVDLTWIVNSNDMNNPNMDVTPSWSLLRQANGFNNQEAYVTKYDESQGKWDEAPSGPATQEPNGMYSITRNGITALGCISVFDEGTVTSVSDIKENKFYVYPTIAKDHIFVQDFNYNNKQTDVVILNSNGTIVKSEIIGADISEVSLEGLSAGNYFIKLNNSENLEFKKFIKQ